MRVDTNTEPVNLIWYQGDSTVATFRLLHGPDSPADLTGINVTSQARSTLGQTMALTVAIPDPTDGTLSIYPPNAGLAPDVYDYDVQFDNGDTIASWIHGRIQVKGDVTA